MRKPFTCLSLLAANAYGQQQQIKLSVDATDISRRLVHARMNYPVKPGPLVYSLGLKIKDDGTVGDVKIGSPPQLAGIAPSVKVVAINDHAYNSTVLHDAIKAAKKSTVSMEFLLRDGDVFKTVKVDYHGGERYPHLERDSSKPDLLTEIISPLAK